jgi:hypothetical protein
MDCGLDGREQRPGLERLAEICAGAGGQAARLHAGFIVACDDDGGNPRAGAHELPLQIETAGAGHLQVQHQAIGGRMRQRREKVVCRCEDVGVEIRCAQQALERLAYGQVVVDDSDAVAGFHHGIASVTDWRER